MSKSLNQVRGFWISMPTFLTNSFGCKANLVLVLRPTVGQRWRISSEEKVQISLKWPPSDCPCRPDSLSRQRSALTSTRTTASILRSLHNRRFWPTDGLVFFSRHGCVQVVIWDKLETWVTAKTCVLLPRCIKYVRYGNDIKICGGQARPQGPGGSMKYQFHPFT